MTLPRLGVNIDHVATLRNARGENYPSPLRAALLCQEYGADGITTHLREDRRHIRDDDINEIIEKISIPLNFEMAPTDEMVDIAVNANPNACCIVPEKREEITTEGGIDVRSNHSILVPKIEKIIKLDQDITIEVDWPSFNDIKNVAIVEDNTESAFVIISKCIKSINTGSERILAKDVAETELQDFLE